MFRKDGSWPRRCREQRLGEAKGGRRDLDGLDPRREQRPPPRGAADAWRCGRKEPVVRWRRPGTLGRAGSEGRGAREPSEQGGGGIHTYLGRFIRAIRTILFPVTAPALRYARYLIFACKLFRAARLRCWMRKEITIINKMSFFPKTSCLKKNKIEIKD